MRRLFAPAPVIVAHPGWLPRDGWGNPNFDQDGHRLAVSHDGPDGSWFHYFGAGFVLGPSERIRA